MHKKILLLFLLPLLVSFTGDSFKLIKSIPAFATTFTTDNLGNLYTASGNQITAYDSLGIQKYNFSDNSLGKLKSIDASNPLKLLLFYPDFAHVIFLDSKLSLQSKIALRNSGIQQPLIACISIAGGFWVYDQQDFQLKLISDNLSVKYESGNISQALGYDIKPTFMCEANNQIYMSNPASGILVFDAFGSYLKTIPLKKINFFQVVKEELVYCLSGEMKSYDLKTANENTIPMPDSDKSSLSGRIGKKKLYLQKKDKIEIFSFEF